MSGAGVARDDDGLHLLVQKPVKDLEAVPLDGLGRFGSVGYPGGVTEINGGLVWQPLINGARNGEAPDPGVEDPYRGGIHRKRMGSETEAPTPPGTASKRRSPGKSAKWADTYASRPENK